MIRSLWTAATGMKAQQLNIDTISNNLANVNTSGFKKSRVNFQDLMYQSLRAAGTPNNQGSQVPTGIEVGHGVRPAATQKLFSQGSFKKTGNPLDVAIEGDGFFQVIRPDGRIAYTRDGSLKRDNNGRIVTSDGYPIQPEITIPEDSVKVTVTAEGNVLAKQANGQLEELGQIELARFSNAAGLKSIGRNLFVQTPASGEPIAGVPAEDGFGTLAQGYLEMSNVKVVEEMVNMIAAQRAYEINSKAIKASDQMLQQANNLKR
ncbi:MULTISPECIES: flagellar basal-body rod protein FlgG [unclassified Candidatus Frackibacter]|jgi:flagellar basal-body rod protein FlgG|uniref:flagellar basal-body rod protein FlgG n=1 Tax=unclassified Candidatus Frackibacter TaxID=2648818 RepID=UPI000794E9E8|nr:MULTISPECIES: flagellar basal-body rod protein FlgG [unclassified Candidatus Frackibacter]KXS45307.1 MAG: flagellar basal-body rod protein FlgG [Candidatus Frackibacter sp. T328-2]SDC10064.1 flagellar basal-body rod protein FlgG [Candidatus Frackibacter sp. WG11]SEM37389.1 flagellar basal-body rod protein FlgG [Candidatus Frackibacter sp. WG12]SFL42853.1 flagellar basal-body rod protein FlgG [Candidatus Frackibacter sp. WG13]